jgi:hypothetical protein
MQTYILNARRYAATFIAMTLASGGCDSPTASPPAVASVAITPTSASVVMGQTTTLVATPRGPSGETLADRTVSWSSSNTAIATVTTAGIVAGVAPGPATITATSEGKSTTAEVTVTPPPAPQARWLATLVYDDVQNRVLMFGGFSSNGSSLGPLNDLWAWDGQRWSFLGMGGPSARGDMLAAWDGTRRRLVVYGGANNDGPLGDTWEWDGSAWTQSATAGPSVRRHVAGGFDRARGRVVLSGGLLGVSETALTDTWEWDGQQWTQWATTMPAVSASPSQTGMAYSETRSALLMLTGSFTTGPTSLLQWDGTAWSTVTAGPAISLPVPMAATGADELTLLQSNGSTLRWQGGVFAQVSASGPTASLGSMAFDKARGRLVLFGGLNGNATSGDTWLWDGTTWSKASGP